MCVCYSVCMCYCVCVCYIYVCVVVYVCVMVYVCVVVYVCVMVHVCVLLLLPEKCSFKSLKINAQHRVCVSVILFNCLSPAHFFVVVCCV